MQEEEEEEQGNVQVLSNVTGAADEEEEDGGKKNKKKVGSFPTQSCKLRSSNFNTNVLSHPVCDCRARRRTSS